MKIIAVSEENNAYRQRFFETVFGKETGYIGVATKEGDVFAEAYFEYPEELSGLLEWVNRNLSKRNIYFCPQLLSLPKRTKANVRICTNIWADLDEADPKGITPSPSVVLTTSPGRYQGLWLLEESVEPLAGESASRRLTYSAGADPSGWDLSQLLRIPLTYNMKYPDSPIVEVSRLAPDIKYPLSIFMELEEPPEYKGVDKDFPKDKIDKLDSEEILKRFRDKLVPSVFNLYASPPEKDWSSALWSLECMCLESGMEAEEAFVVCWNAACNKYKRDGRTPSELWRELLKAQAMVEIKAEEDDKYIELPSLLTEEERTKLAKQPKTFVERYVEWCRSRSDAAWQYHQAGAFIILSCLLAESVRLPTSFGTVQPNLWFMILGDTTLTRKTTAMEMAMDLLLNVYPEAILATDGSIEGLLTELSVRPGKTSLFWRDEFSGMLESMRKKDYYSGMVEALTKLYDGKYQKRILRKETIEVKDPVFILFAGGIKTRIIELLDIDYIINGFVPRFIFIVAEPDLSGFKPAGPASEELLRLNTELVEELNIVRENYDAETVMVVGEQHISSKRVWNAQLSKDAWERYNAMEKALVEAGLRSDNPDIYTPTMDRLAKSGLKIAVLMAAARQDPSKNESGTVHVELDDVIRAIYYIDQWKDFSTQVVNSAGKSLSEKTLERALILIRRGKETRSAIMRSMHLTSRETDLILDTLEQRGFITRTKHGKKEKLLPTTMKNV